MKKTTPWELKKVDTDNFHWKLDNDLEVSSFKKITLNCNNIEWIEKFIYETEEGETILINKIHSFDRGSIRVPISSSFPMDVFGNGTHYFSLYDLDGDYSFQGGYYDYEPDDEESLIDLYGDDIFEELDNIGTDTSTVILSGSITIKK